MYTSPQPSHGVQFACMSRATWTGSDTMCSRTAFLVPLSDTSKSFFFFFPMVLRRRAAVVGVEVSYCGRCQERCQSTFKTGRSRKTMILKAAQKLSRHPLVRAQKRLSQF
jgi:hypothetical protein